EHLLEDFSHLAPPSRHEVLDGRVLKISGQNVFIDVGYKSDGIAPLSQFLGPDGKSTVGVGDIVQVMVEQGRSEEGYVMLSHERAARLKVWDHLEQVMEQQATIHGAVTGRIKGGLQVDIGVRAFMPASQIDVRPARNVDQYIGQSIPVRVVKLNRRRGNV